MKYLTLIFVVLLCKFSTNVKAQVSEPITHYESYFMPGGGYGAYFPIGLDTSGYYSGAIIEYQFYSKINQNDSWGPSHARFYGKLQILNGSSEEMKDLFVYGLGIDFSLEKNPKRNFLIPYFGFEANGISSKAYGTNFAFYPLGGLRLVALKNLSVNVSAMYAYAIKNFDIFRGWQTQATLNFSLW